MLLVAPRYWFFEHTSNELGILLREWMRDMPSYHLPSIDELISGDDPYSSHLYNLIYDEIIQSYDSDVDEDERAEDAHHVLQDGYPEIIVEVEKDIRTLLNSTLTFFVSIEFGGDFTERKNPPLKEVW